jgi:type I restriction enzyme, S subunit
VIWPRVSLNSLKAQDSYAFVGGPFGSNLTTRDYVDAGVPVIRGNNLPDDRLFLDDEFAFISEEKADALAANTAYPGDIVFTQRGTLGQVGLIPHDSRFPRYIISQSQMKLTVDRTLFDPGFIYYFFRLPATVQMVVNCAVTSGVPHINLGIMKGFEIPQPDLPTQEDIVRILSAYDDLMENNRRRMALLEEAARQLYREWFVRLRFPGHEHTRVLDGVPDCWERIHLGSVCDTQYGFTETATDEPVGPKFLRGTDINKTPFIDWSTVPYCHIDEILQRRYQLRVGDLVIIRMADPGKVAIVERDIDAVFASYLIRLLPKEPRLTPYYLYYTLSDDAYQGFISGVSTGSTRKTASGPLLVDFHLLLPREELVRVFEEAILPLRQQITNLLIQNEKLRAARDLLLPRLMSGEIAV